MKWKGKGKDKGKEKEKENKNKIKRKRKKNTKKKRKRTKNNIKTVFHAKKKYNFNKISVNFVVKIKLPLKVALNVKKR